ncbi:M28 family peptidase [Geomonas sp. Red32]|uniref:M28 family peptidase n=1 Tax=Geomonas sp. Red32 TaxID=2912856 RepID=UPI002545E4C7|nr:M28 family peptidase [Geomonas sp. Red32]
MMMVQDLLDAVSGDAIRGHVAALEGIRHPVVAPQALLAAESYIEGEFRRLGYQVERHPFTDHGETYHNLIASRPGSPETGGRVLVVAHFDSVSVSPGADDNASGVAVLLELARVLEAVRFKRRVELVAVNLEEPSLHDGFALKGSAALARRAREEGWEIEGVLVLESVGFAGDVPQAAPPLPVAAPTVGDFLAVVANEASAKVLQLFCGEVKRLGISLPLFPLAVPGNGEILPDSRRSDHAPFWDLGYPALMLTDTADLRNPNYHAPTDTIGTLNIPFATEVCRATLAAVMALAEGEVS